MRVEARVRGSAGEVKTRVRPGAMMIISKLLARTAASEVRSESTMPHAERRGVERFGVRAMVSAKI